MRASPWIYAVLHRLPILGDLPLLSFQYGMNAPDPAPLFAAAIGVGGFLLSTYCYTEAVNSVAFPFDTGAGAALRIYLVLIVRRATLILGSGIAVLLFAQWYLRLPLSLSLLAALAVSYFLFRGVMASPALSGAQGIGRISAEEAEARRREGEVYRAS